MPRSGPPRSQETALSRIQFSEVQTADPLHAALEQAASLAELKPRVLTVVGRSRRFAEETYHRELRQVMEEHGHVGSEVRRTLGDVATAILLAGRGAGIIVLQAAHISP